MVDGIDHGAAWGPRIVAAKYHAVESAWSIVDRAFEVTGGFGIFPASHLERLFRDARLGRIHPANAYVTKEIMDTCVQFHGGMGYLEELWVARAWRDNRLERSPISCWPPN